MQRAGGVEALNVKNGGLHLSLVARRKSNLSRTHFEEGMTHVCCRIARRCNHDCHNAMNATMTLLSWDSPHTAPSKIGNDAKHSHLTHTSSATLPRMIGQDLRHVNQSFPLTNKSVVLHHINQCYVISCGACYSENEKITQQNSNTTKSFGKRSPQEVDTVTKPQGQGETKASLHKFPVCVYHMSDGSQDRQQNLTAQRNRRKLGVTRPTSIDELTHIGVLGQRLKEQSKSTSSEHSSDSHDLQEPLFISSDPSAAPSATETPPAFSPLPQLQRMDTTMGDDISMKSMPPWTNFDSMIPEMPLSTSPDFLTYPLSQGCTCNGETGPCAHHKEEIRYQTLSADTSAPSQFMSWFPGSSIRGVYEGSNASEPKIPPQHQRHHSQGNVHHQPSHHPFSTSISSTPLKSVACVVDQYENEF